MNELEPVEHDGRIIHIGRGFLPCMRDGCGGRGYQSEYAVGPRLNQNVYIYQCFRCEYRRSIKVDEHGRMSVKQKLLTGKLTNGASDQ